MKLSIIIVSYNTKDLLCGCLESLFKKTSKKTLEQTEVLVVDNASQDGSVEIVKKKFPSIQVIQNNQNTGFARANNQGIKKSKGEFVLLLNSDTVIEENAVDKTLEYIQNHKNVGVLGCQLKNADGSIQHSAGNIPNLVNVKFWMTFIDDVPLLNRMLHPYHIQYNSFYTKSQNIGWVSGAFFLIRKIAINETGLLDENIFMYGEEVDLCMRMEKKKWNIYYYKDAVVTHLKGGSGNGDVAGLLEEFDALKLIWKKHYPAWHTPFLRVSLKSGALLRYVIFGIILGNEKKRNIYAKVFYMA